MKRLRVLVFGIIALVIAPALAQIPAPLPDIAVGVDPANPTSSDALSLALSGTWPNGCIPEGLEVTVVTGDSLWIDLLLPGWNTKGDCDDVFCLQVLTPWELSDMIGPLPAGTYDVFVRAVACQEFGSYEQIDTLEIAFDGAAPFDQFFPGQRIVLLEDDPPGGAGLTAGRGGTVICCDAGDCAGDVLVSWDFYSEGKVDLSACAEADSRLFPAGSALWVNPQQVFLGRHFNRCGTVHAGLEGCVYLETDDGQEYNLVAAGDLYLALSGGSGLAFGDRVRVQGLFNNTPPGPGVIRLCPQRDGDIYHPLLSPCPEPGPDPDPKPDPDPEPKPGPDEIVIGIGGNPLILVKDAMGPGYTYAGCTTLSLELNFHALLSVEITPAVGVSGTWSGTLDPDTLGPGDVTTQLCVKVENLDIGTLPVGNDIQIATVSLFAVPAP